MGKMKIGEKIARQHNIIELLDNKIKLERRLQQATEILRMIGRRDPIESDTWYGCFFCDGAYSSRADVDIDHTKDCPYLRAKQFCEEGK